MLAQARLLTIAGPAGCRKTRLALQVASSLVAQFEDDVFFVPLAPVRDADSLLWAIAERLEGQFYAGDEPRSILLDHLTTEMRNAPPGQQSMRAAIARSWLLLDDK